MTIAIHVDQSRAESLLGASECAGVLGADKYNPPIKIWRRHRGMPVNDDADKNDGPAYWGTVLEPVVRGHYAVQSGRLVVVPTASFEKDGWIRATPDGISIPVPLGISRSVISDDDDDFAGINGIIADHRRFGSAGNLQVKTCSAWLEDDWRDGPPAKYEIQVRIEMAVADLPWSDVVCLCGGQKYLGPFRIVRDVGVEAHLLKSLREFWAMVLDGREPTVDHTDEWRMNVSEKMERARPVSVEANGKLLEDVLLWRERRRMVTLAKRDEGEIENRLLLRLSAAGATRIDIGGGDKITAYKPRKDKPTWAIKAPASWKEDAK